MYDPMDEKTDALFSTLLLLLRNVPDRLAKNALSGLLEETALLEACLRDAGVEPPLGEARMEAIGRFWEEIEESRDTRAGALLKAIQSEEF